MRLIDADSIQIPHFTLATDRIKMIDAIDEAPTIEPKRGEWIPCSERLPKDEGIFLVTMDTYVFNEYSHSVGTSFYSSSFGWVNASSNKVLAWMPLPKPYGEREGE